jgi:hypothetical protein
MTALEFNLAQKIQCRTKPSLVADLNYADNSTLTIVASPNPIGKVWQSIIFLCRFVSTM